MINEPSSHLLGAGLDSMPPCLLAVTGDLVRGLVAGLMPPEANIESLIASSHGSKDQGGGATTNHNIAFLLARNK